MTPVGGSRHYEGVGLGSDLWKCPACGEENAGPLEAGCAVCGSGKPGRHIGTQPPPAPPRPPVEDEPVQDGRLSVAQQWAVEHPTATLEEAFSAGARWLASQQRRQYPQEPRMEPVAFTPEHIINRTIVASLVLFRDQVLAGDPEETTTGEWLTKHQVTALIAQLMDHIGEREAVRG